MGLLLCKAAGPSPSWGVKSNEGCSAGLVKAAMCRPAQAGSEGEASTAQGGPSAEAGVRAAQAVSRRGRKDPQPPGQQLYKGYNFKTRPNAELEASKWRR